MLSVLSIRDAEQDTLPSQGQRDMGRKERAKPVAVPTCCPEAARLFKTVGRTDMRLRFDPGSALAGMAGVALSAAAMLSLQYFVSLVVSALVFWAVWRWVFRWGQGRIGLTVFFFYATLAVGLGAWHEAIAPSSWGLTAVHLGAGADDSYFYALATGDLGVGVPTRSAELFRQHTYPVLLSGWVGLLSYLYRPIYPLDLIFLNVLVLSFMPFFAEKAALALTRDERAARFTFWATLVCPFILQNGLILVRDGCLASFQAGFLYGVLSRRYWLAAVLLGLGLFLRLETGVMILVSGIVCILVDTDGNAAQGGPGGGSSRASMVRAGVAFFAVVSGLFVVAYAALDAEGIGIGFRYDILDFLSRSESGGGGTLYRLTSLPTWLRVPLMTLFFFATPVFSVNYLFFSDGSTLVPRALMGNLFAALFLLYLAFFVRASVRAVREWNLPVLALGSLYLLEMAVLSQASMQIRHKVAVMPIFYILVGYGYTYSQSFGVAAGWIVSVTYALFVLVFLMR